MDFQGDGEGVRGHDSGTQGYLTLGEVQAVRGGTDRESSFL